jgi:hypothetical protein
MALNCAVPGATNTTHWKICLSTFYRKESRPRTEEEGTNADDRQKQVAANTANRIRYLSATEHTGISPEVHICRENGQLC